MFPKASGWYQLHALAHGDDRNFTDWTVPLRRSVESDISQGLYLSINCTESMPFEDLAGLRRDAAGTLYGSFRADQLAAACAVWPRGKDDAALHQIKPWNGPVLALVGTLDPVTPEPYAERAMKAFPNGRLLRIPHAGHGPSTDTQTKCEEPLVAAFIRTADAQSLDARCLERVQHLPFVTGPTRPPPG
jgi:pimeloyl-ACP methyl ester carboxylesterase